MRFQEAYKGWQDKGLTQDEAGQLLGVSGRTFRRQIARFEAEGMQGVTERFGTISATPAASRSNRGATSLFGSQAWQRVALIAKAV